MDSNEKASWIAPLWMWSLFTVAYLIVGGFTGKWDTPLIVGAILFGGTFIAWIFRLVYLAGKRSR